MYVSFLYGTSGFFAGAKFRNFLPNWWNFFQRYLIFTILRLNQNQILAVCPLYQIYTLSELVDQQFKIGNVLKYLSIVISYAQYTGFCPDSLFCMGGVCIINENNVVHSFFRPITCRPFFMFTIVKYFRISLLVWAKSLNAYNTF